MPSFRFSPRSLVLLLCFMPVFPLLAGDIPLSGPIPFEAFDGNGDRMISPQEYVEAHNIRKQMRKAANMPDPRMLEPGFNYFDANGDNLLSREELDAGRAGLQQNRGGGMGQGMNMGRNMPSFADFDLNGDGALTSEEFYDARAKRMYDRAEQGYPLRNAASAPTFEEIDTNKDGKVDPEEFKTHQMEHRRMRNN